MDPDLTLILGLILLALSIPGFMSAFSDRRAPRAPLVTLAIAGGLITFAVLTKPGGYTLEQIPDVFYAVVGRLVN